jgi:3-(3-hydroxy-phenyl)propionate hydroxylase
MFDAIILGGGPVGMVTALALVRKGLRVALFEANEAIPTQNRAATLHSSTLSLLDGLGLTPWIIEQGLVSSIFQWRDFVSREVVVEYDFGLLSDEHAYAFAVQLEQHKLVEKIQRLLTGNSLFTFFSGCRVESINEHADRVQVFGIDAQGLHHAEGRYLIGCDGARSAVRKHMNSPFTGYTFEEKFAVVTVRHDFEASMNFRLRNYYSDTDCWFGIFKVPGAEREGIWRTTYPLKHDLSENLEQAIAQVQAVYAHYLPLAVGAPITQVNTYNVHQRVAEQFHAGRCVLAGDSAHVNNPLGGLGLNSGIQDALNLADKLPDVLSGAPQLLEQYDRQRRQPAIAYVQAQSIQNKKVMEERSPQARAANREQMRETVADPRKHLAYLRRASLWTMLEDSLLIA